MSATNGNLFYWRSGADDVPVAMCAVPRRLGPDGCSLSLVFTDRGHRGAGHAEALVRAVCSEKLKSLKFMTLLADLASKNNTSKLYERCGFERNGRFGDIRFVRQESAS
jgi:predicted GNAT family acetyltransferase